MTAYLVGIGAAILVLAYARITGFDRDRAFYPTVLVVVASYYILFAVMGGSMPALLAESAVTVLFALVAYIGFRSNLWLVAIALAGHGLFDLVHGRIVSNPGVPGWWPAWCMSYDVVAGGCLAWLLGRGKLTSRPREAKQRV